MNNKNRHEEREFLQAEDALDELLLQSPLPEPPAWFVSETMARCRRESQDSVPASGQIQWRWMLGFLGTAGLAAVMITVMMLTLRPAPVAQVVLPTPTAAADAFMVVASVNSSSSEEECDDSSL